MTSLHWQNIALWTIDHITESLRGLRDTNDLRRLVDRLGDMLNTGIPGGIDMDITTPL